VSNHPPKPELPMFPACNQGTAPEGRWPALDAAAVAHTGPGDVVLFVAGNWECQDVEEGGRWTDITHPAFQREELRRMQQLVGIATAHGAHLDLATMPAMAAGAAFHEAPFPEDSPARRAIYNRLVRTVASEYPGRVSVLDLGHILSPDGRFTQYIDGVQVRTADGVHTPSYAPNNPFAGNSSEAVADRFYRWLSGRIWPPLLRSAAALPGREAGIRPVRFMVVGDSIATTLAVGLAADSVPRFGVEVVDQTALGCDLDDLDAYTDGNLDIPVSPCVHWASVWRSSLSSVHPDVVGVLLGRWEITDHVDGGQLVHIGQPAWDAHLTDELRQVVAVLSSTGAKVVLFTMPYLGVPPTPNGTVYPENGPVRVAAFNRLLAEVAKERPGVVTLVDLNRLLDPAGHFQPVIDGITVRWADGIHISQDGGQWLQQFVLPTVRRLGLDHHTVASSTS